jgi:hypothetical protein
MCTYARKVQCVYSVSVQTAGKHWFVQWQILFSKLSTSTYPNIKKQRTYSSGHSILTALWHNQKCLKEKRDGCSCSERITLFKDGYNHRMTICRTEDQWYLVMRRKLPVFKRSYDKTVDE